jgi:hypothetical protein
MSDNNQLKTFPLAARNETAGTDLLTTTTDWALEDCIAMLVNNAHST